MLLIACANVANLLLARAAARQGRSPCAPRSAPAAGGWCASCSPRACCSRSLGGVARAAPRRSGAVRALSRLAPATCRAADEIARSTAACSSSPSGWSSRPASSSALAPALQLSRPDLAASLKEAGAAAGAARGQRSARAGGRRGGPRPRAARRRRAADRELRPAPRVDPGFEPRQGAHGEPRPERSGILEGPPGQRLLRPPDAAGARLPGVAAAGGDDLGAAAAPRQLRPRHRRGPPGAAAGGADRGGLRTATPDLFRALGTPLLAGRDLSPHDGPGAPAVALINRAMARTSGPAKTRWGSAPDRSASPGNPLRTVVGVVGDARRTALEEEARAAVYSCRWPRTPSAR